METKELSEVKILGENPDSSSGLVFERVYSELSNIEEHADKIISIVRGAEYLEEGLKKTLLNECGRLKSTITQTCVNLCTEPDSGVTNADEESESEDDLSSYELVEGPSILSELEDGLPLYNAFEMFSVRTKGVNKDRIPVPFKTVPGPEKVTGLQVAVAQYADPLVKECQVIIVEPTRELAIQTQKLIREWKSSTADPRRLKCELCIGGTEFKRTKERLKKFPHVIVGTPGRLADHLIRNHVDLNKVRVCILDHADQLLSWDADDRVLYLLTVMPLKVQMISVTKLSSIAVALHRKFFRYDPLMLFVRNGLTFYGIKQYYADITTKSKTSYIWDIFNAAGQPRCVIYCNSKRAARKIQDDLGRNHFYDTAPILFNMNTKERDIMIDEFLSGKRPIMICTDMRAAGIDLKDISLVILHDVPSNMNDYLSRVGLNGPLTEERFRVAVSLTTSGDMKLLKQIGVVFKTEIRELPQNLAEMFVKEGKNDDYKQMIMEHIRKNEKNGIIAIEGAAKEKFSKPNGQNKQSRDNGTKNTENIAEDAKPNNRREQTKGNNSAKVAGSLTQKSNEPKGPTEKIKDVKPKDLVQQTNGDSAAPVDESPAKKSDEPRSNHDQKDDR